jgi:hypothetical protein
MEAQKIFPYDCKENLLSIQYKLETSINNIIKSPRNWQHNRTNKMHFFVLSLLRKIASTCFEHLFAHHQEVLYIQQLVYSVCIVGWLLAGSEWNWYTNQWCTEGGGVWWVQTPPIFRSWSKFPVPWNIYIRNNLIRIRVSFIWKSSETPD